MPKQEAFEDTPGRALEMLHKHRLGEFQSLGRQQQKAVTVTESKFTTAKSNCSGTPLSAFTPSYGLLRTLGFICMEPHLLTRKRCKCDFEDDEPKTKKCSLDPEQAGKTENFTLQNSYGNPEDLTEDLDLSRLISLWSDTKRSVNKTLHFLQSSETIEDVLLNDSVNKKFLEFHRDITEECGVEDKQHSWAVIEKREEVVMYGPYYPDYNKGLHSEDIIIKQTEELLESNRNKEVWEVFVFTMNSPCLCRSSEPHPCMIKLVLKAKEWYLKFRVKTNVGYKKCWGFKGTKETIFRIINYNQVEAVQNSGSYEQYVSQNLTGVNLLCKNVFALLKTMLNSGPQGFDLSLQGLEWKSYFKGMQLIQESAHDPDKESVIKAAGSMTEATKCLSSEEPRSFQEHLDRGQAFASEFRFTQEMTESTKSGIRLAFQTCWREMLQDRYTEEIKDALTEEFNKCTNLLFIRDFENVTSSFLHIGRVDFRDEAGTSYIPQH